MFGRALLVIGICLLNIAPHVSAMDRKGKTWVLDGEICDAHSLASSDLNKWKEKMNCVEELSSALILRNLAALKVFAPWAQKEGVTHVSLLSHGERPMPVVHALVERCKADNFSEQSKVFFRQAFPLLAEHFNVLAKDDGRTIIHKLNENSHLALLFRSEDSQPE